VVPRTFHSKVVVGGQRLNQLYPLRHRVQVCMRAVGVENSQDNPGSESRPRHRLRALVRARPNVTEKEARAPLVNLAHSLGLERRPRRLNAASRNRSVERKKARKKHRRQDRNRSTDFSCSRLAESRRYTETWRHSAVATTADSEDRGRLLSACWFN
jgi:hypothetical protein